MPVLAPPTSAHAHNNNYMDPKATTQNGIDSVREGTVVDEEEEEEYEAPIAVAGELAVCCVGGAGGCGERGRRGLSQQQTQPLPTQLHYYRRAKEGKVEDG